MVLSVVRKVSVAPATWRSGRLVRSPIRGLEKKAECLHIWRSVQCYGIKFPSDSFNQKRNLKEKWAFHLSMISLLTENKRPYPRIRTNITFACSPD